MEKSHVMMERNEAEQTTLAYFADEQFDIWTDRIIQALVLFLTIVGIPFTIYVVLQFFFSL